MNPAYADLELTSFYLKRGVEKISRIPKGNDKRDFLTDAVRILNVFPNYSYRTNAIVVGNGMPFN